MKKLKLLIVITMLAISLLPNVLADAKENVPQNGGQYTLNRDDIG